MALIIGPVITSIDSELAVCDLRGRPHDAELWWNVGLQETLRNAGLIDEIAMSYTARIDSLEDQLVHGEHGNQFDPTNRYTDYRDPLARRIGAHVVDEIVRPPRVRSCTAPSSSTCTPVGWSAGPSMRLRPRRW